MNHSSCVAVLAAAKASLHGGKHGNCGAIAIAAQKGADECVRMLAYLGATLVHYPHPMYKSPFWIGEGLTSMFPDTKGRVRRPQMWEDIVVAGGDEGTPESLALRVRMLKEAGVHDPRDGTSW